MIYGGVLEQNIAYVVYSLEGYFFTCFIENNAREILLFTLAV